MSASAGANLVIDNPLARPVSGDVAHAAAHLLIAGGDPAGAGLRTRGPSAVVPVPVRTCVMPIPALPHVIPVRPHGADLALAHWRRIGHDADVQVAGHERRWHPG